MVFNSDAYSRCFPREEKVEVQESAVENFNNTIIENEPVIEQNDDNDLGN